MPRRNIDDRSDQDLRTSLASRLAKETYECMICFEPIRKQHSIWPCDNCWALFHGRCISKWIAKSTSNLSQVQQQQQLLLLLRSQEHIPQSWRCPGCQRVRSAKPPDNSCFCGKHRRDFSALLNHQHISHWDPLGVPHGCQEVCGRPLQDFQSTVGIGYRCPHTCTLLCHPGPCPSCESHAPAPFNRCYCGREELPLKCADLAATTSSANGDPFGIPLAQQRSCRQSCDKVLDCGNHRCQDECHPGRCKPCSVTLAIDCYCGQTTKRQLACADTALDTAAAQPFSCGKRCGSLLDCGEHECSQKCHPPDIRLHQCKSTPAAMPNCPCGMSDMNSLYRRHRPDGLEQRTACTQPILCCDQVCGKPVPRALYCQHARLACGLPCHTGPCEIATTAVPGVSGGVCAEMVNVRCRCGETIQTVRCDQLKSEIVDGVKRISSRLLCDQVCRERMKCGRHRCLQQCCPLQSDKHECRNLCGRPLRCGNHNCQLVCHKGTCPPCSAVSAEPYYCHCGGTFKVSASSNLHKCPRSKVMKQESPIKCGEPLPVCPYPCVRSRPCGHHLLAQLSRGGGGGSSSSVLQHACHPDSEPCPPCATIVAKRCRCGKGLFQNAPCYLEGPMCSSICQKPLLCGHLCKRGCHWGECMITPAELAADWPCKQLCGTLRPCGHPCAELCHGPAVAVKSESGPSLCPQPQTACKQITQVQCKCGNIKVQIRCCEIPNGSRYLACKADCEVQESHYRRQVSLRLSSAGADEASKPDQAMPAIISAGAGTLPFPKQLLLSVYKNLLWTQGVERQLDQFITSKDQVSLRFSGLRESLRELMLQLIAVNYRGLLAAESKAGAATSIGESLFLDHPVVVVSKERMDDGSVATVIKLPEQLVSDCARALCPTRI